MTTIVKVTAGVILIELRSAVGHISHIDNVVVSVETDDGVTGSGYSWLPDERTAAASLQSRLSASRLAL